MTIDHNDELVLDTIFAANNEFTSDFLQLTEQQQNEPSTEDDPIAFASIKQQEHAAVTLAASVQDPRSNPEKITEAIDMMTAIIESCPSYGSAYNNRAQMYRLMGNSDAALKDLDKAIAVSCTKPAILKQAYTQRGLLYRYLGDSVKAEQDLADGARYGNALAKQTIVQNNPYAKLCSAMVHEIMKPYR